MSRPALVVVGIGADGWTGLGEAARAAILGADEVIGSERQLALLPGGMPPGRPWPSPIGPLVDELVTRTDGCTCVLASGDPMLHGIGATLARRRGTDGLVVHPHPSAFAWACARLGWPAAEVELLSAVAHPADEIARVLAPGRRVVVYVAGVAAVARVAAVLREHGYGPSRLSVMSELGGPGENRRESTAADWGDEEVSGLHLLAVECAAAPGTPAAGRVPGLPDELYASDGQLTKRHVRAATLAALVPLPFQRLWDVGAGSGSIAIEWLRAEPSAHAVAVEADAARAERIGDNARRLGVPVLTVVHGRAPGALDSLEPPDAVFVGGGLSTDGLLEKCWDALSPGGRIVANAVTLEGEQRLGTACAAHGGTLVRIEISHAEPIGRYTGWRPQRPVVQWAAAKGPA